MNINELGQLLAQYGFPVAVAVYFMVAMNKTLSRLTSAIDDMRKCVEELKKQQ